MAAPLRTTPLHALHREHGARMVAFAGWDMPLHYGSQLDEHHATRRAATVFDVSHMLAIDIVGREARAYLRRLLANDVARLTSPGAALYTGLLNDAGGLLDDLIVYRVNDAAYRAVVNAATADADLAWMTHQRDAAGHDCAITPRRDLALLAVQGPQARARAHAAWPATLAAAGLERFHAAIGADTWVARTGYTGEDGYEIMLPAEQAAACWRALAGAGVTPAGLGARDTLRLEAGLGLYGQDMDAGVTPYECGLGWTVVRDGDRAFIGREALATRPVRGVLRGLVLLERGVMRAHQPVTTAQGPGCVTSGGYGPTVGASIALARLPGAVMVDEVVTVTVRDRALRARVVLPPFVRDGRARVSAAP